MPSPLPPFAEKINAAYNAAIAHAFILHGNGVVDYADNENQTLEGVLNRLWKSPLIVAHYSMATGLTFPTKMATDAKGTTQEVSPSQDRFLREAFGPDMATQQPEDLLGPLRDPNKAIPLFDQLLRRRGDDQDSADGVEKVYRPLLALIVDMAEFVIPDGDIGVRPQNERRLIATMERWGRDAQIMFTGNAIVLTARSLSDVHARLRLSGSKYEAIEVSIPSYEDRLAYIKFVRERQSSTFEYEDGLDDESFARLTAGLSRVGIEDIVYKVPAGEKLERESIVARKREIIKTEYADVIEMMDPNFGFEQVGGYQPIKDFFRKRIVKPMREGRGSDWPGVLLVGPPGTGKTTLATALAYECGVPAVRLKIGQLKNKYVGETEKNLRRALALIREMAPVLVFIDEIDTDLPNRQDENQDSGVSKSILSEFMPFLSDPEVRKRTQFVGASNRSDGIDAALKRVGRFDKVIPMLMPTQDERIEIIKALWHVETAVSGRALPEASVLKFVAEKTGMMVPTAMKLDIGWSGSELRGLIRAAGEEMKDTAVGNEPEDSGKALKDALDYVISNTSDVLRLTALALADCNDLRLLPEDYRKGYDRAKWLMEAASYAAEAARPAPVERKRRSN